MTKATIKTDIVKETIVVEKVVEKEVKTVCLEMDLETAQMIQNMFGFLVIDQRYQRKVQSIYDALYHTGVPYTNQDFWENLESIKINCKKVRIG